MNKKLSNLFYHETKKKTTTRFIIALMLLLAYVIFLYIRFGSLGIYLGTITWSAFVMATPLPDGGLILDFPIRLLSGMRMIYSEIIVWTVAISLNVYSLIINPEIYEKTVITQAFGKILTNPWPNWIIILISAVGTFIGIYFSDELLDLVMFSEREKYHYYKNIYRLILVIFLLIIFYYSYRYILSLFGINIFN